MIVRVRDENINTADFWDWTWEQEPSWHDGFGMRPEHCDRLIAGLREGFRVLDVGGGRGEFLNRIGSACHRTLLDHSRFAVEGAVERGWAEEGIVADCTRPLPFDDHSFDAVFCCEVLEHVEDPQGLVSELLRVTRGFLGVTTPYRNTVDDRQHVWAFDEEDIRAMVGPDASIEILGGPTILALVQA